MPSQEAPIYGVFAATGEQGGSTAEALLDQGVRDRALIRRPDSKKAQALEARGVAEAMFIWFAELPAFQADCEATRNPTSGSLNLSQWLSTTGWKPSTR
ncbi:NmrA family NAD(P)-binding protein [Arthrobacter sp. NPDC089319]|uniref:NmrA family NAD(P)-binding protein n=1 Tax=Arthrobacter sp. NPDC089319 TaxID=3155915 RepID=UPI00344685E2